MPSFKRSRFVRLFSWLINLLALIPACRGAYAVRGELVAYPVRAELVEP